MSLASEIRAAKERLQTILESSNAAIMDKGGTAASDLSGVPTAITALVDSNLKPWNIPDGITIFGVTGTMKIHATSEIPEDLPVSKADADAAYEENVGAAPTETDNMMVLVDNSGNVIFGYLAEDFAITEFDPTTTDFKAKGWKRLSYHVNGELAGTWTYDDFSNTASGGMNFIKNIRSCSREKLYYYGIEVWPDRFGNVSWEPFYEGTIITADQSDDGSDFPVYVRSGALCPETSLVIRPGQISIDGKTAYYIVMSLSGIFGVGNVYLGENSAGEPDDGFDLYAHVNNFHPDTAKTEFYTRTAGEHNIKIMLGVKSQ